jgi:hypothetical protein
MTLGAAAFVYFQTFDQGYPWCRTIGVILSAIAVAAGVVIMSVLGRIQGKEIDYASEKDPHRSFLFKTASRTLYVQLAVLLVSVVLAGALALIDIWSPNESPSLDEAEFVEALIRGWIAGT